MENNYDLLRLSFYEGLCSAFPDFTEEQRMKIVNVLDEKTKGFTIKKETYDMIVSEDGYINVLKQYMVDCKMKGLSEKTISGYNLIIGKFFTTVQKKVEDIKANDIRRYLASYMTGAIGKNVSNRTINQYRIILKSFFGWAAAMDIVDKDPTKTIDAIKYEKKQRKSMTQEDLERIRLACESDRERAIVEFMYSTGCRISEVCSAKKKDIDWSNRSISLFGKGKVERTGYLNSKCYICLKKYLESRQDDSEYLFVSLRNGKKNIGAGAMRKALNKIYSRTSEDISVHVTPHIYRHTTATIAVRSGMPIEVVQKMLGHRQISTTMIYAETSDTSVKENHQRYVV